MKNNLIVFILFMVMGNILMPGCVKKQEYNPHTTVSGKVVLNGNPTNFISGADVYLLRTKDNCWTCGYGAFASVKSDANGQFYFEFDAEAGKSYAVAAKALNCIDNGLQEVTIQNGQNNQPTIKLDAKAYLKIHLKNVSGVDTVSLVLPIYTSANTAYYGKNIDTTVSTLVYGNRNNDISIFTFCISVITHNC